MAAEAEIKFDAKTVIILIVIFIVATFIVHFMVHEKIGPNGKVFKGLMSTPAVPSGVAPASSGNTDGMQNQ